MDPELWDRISNAAEMDNAASDSDDEVDSAVGAGAECEDDPFADEADFDDDSWMEPAQLFARILNPSSGGGDGAADDSGPGMADEAEVDLEGVHVPDGADLGRGKRRRVSNKKFDGFVGH